jgi:hypothetical protein
MHVGLIFSNIFQFIVYHTHMRTYPLLHMVSPLLSQTMFVTTMTPPSPQHPKNKFSLILTPTIVLALIMTMLEPPSFQEL